MSPYLVGSWLFLLGSLAFTAEAVLGILAGVSARSILVLVGCVLFTVGCVYFVIDAQRQRPR